MMNNHLNEEKILGGCCGRPMHYDATPKCNYNSCCMNEYAYKQKACIRNKQPDCEAQAVIPSITVETVDGITNLANCLVHVTSTNTTYYVDDKHRIMITWAGPVDIPGYDMEGNPEGFKDQIVTDTEAGIAVIYDKNGVGYTFGIEYGSLQDAINNKLDEMAEDGTLERIISNYMENAVLSFNSITSMKSANNLSDGALVALTGENSVDDGKGSFYVIRPSTSEDIYDDYNIVRLSNFPGLIAERASNLFEKYDMEFHSFENASSGYVIKFPNQKVMLFDTGQAGQWDSINSKLTSLGITKIDYLVVSHFHPDHYGNVDKICQYYDVSECTCYVGMKPDFANHASQIEETEEYFDEKMQWLRSLGLNPIVPQNDSYINVGDAKLHFLNTSLELAEEYDYYSEQAEWHDTGKCNLNLFSLVCEIMYGANVVTLTGDIELATEKAITEFMHKSTIMSIPHHGVNHSAYKPFYLLTNPEYSLLQFVAEKGSVGWIYTYFQGFAYLQEIGTNFVAPAWTDGDNGVYSFYMSEYSYKTSLYGTYAPKSRVLHIGERRSNVRDFVDYLSYNNATVTLEALCHRMEPGDSLTVYWTTQDSTTFAQLYTDLSAKFPFFGGDTRLVIETVGESGMRKITADRSTYKAEYTTNFTNFEKIFGTGYITDTNGTSSLVEKISALPVGQYICGVFRDDDNLVSGKNFVLSVDVVGNDGEALMASIIARNRNTNPADQYAIFSGYINTSSDPQFSWKRIAIEA